MVIAFPLIRDREATPLMALSVEQEIPSSYMPAGAERKLIVSVQQCNKGEVFYLKTTDRALFANCSGNKVCM